MQQPAAQGSKSVTVETEVERDDILSVLSQIFRGRALTTIEEKVVPTSQLRAEGLQGPIRDVRISNSFNHNAAGLDNKESSIPVPPETVTEQMHIEPFNNVRSENEGGADVTPSASNDDIYEAWPEPQAV